VLLNFIKTKKNSDRQKKFYKKHLASQETKKVFFAFIEFEGFEGQRVHKPSKNWQGMIKSFA
jgi:hypothetical protein